MTYNIALMIGSLRARSFNKRIANAVVRLAPNDVSFTLVQIGELPLYNQDNNDMPSQAVMKLKDVVTAIDAVMFTTPEYNRSVRAC